jgi:hypothetical protein
VLPSDHQLRRDGGDMGGCRARALAWNVRDGRVPDGKVGLGIDWADTFIALATFGFFEGSESPE